jgi:thermolabile hemolysin
MSISHYSRLVLFGDSHTDGGDGTPGLCALSHDMRPMPPYFHGRWTNGPVWAEYAALALGILYEGATNFAVGGAKTGTDNMISDPIFVDTGMLAQVRRYVAHHPVIDPHALLVLWAGANDLLAATPGEEETALITTAVQNILTALQMVLDAQAQMVVVCTVPSLGHCPQGLVAERTRWHQLSQQFNQQLIDAIRAITNRHRATIALAPMAAYVDQVMADPAACGFAHTDEEYLLGGCSQAAVLAACWGIGDRRTS